MENRKNSEPRDERKMRMNLPVWLIYLLSIIGIIYLLNPTAGLLELIPDNLPVVGNLDEGAAALLVWQGLSEIINSRKNRNKNPNE